MPPLLSLFLWFLRDQIPQKTICLIIMHTPAEILHALRYYFCFFKFILYYNEVLLVLIFKDDANCIFGRFNNR